MQPSQRLRSPRAEINSWGSAGGVDHGRLRSGGLTHRAHKINRPAAASSRGCLVLRLPHPQEGQWVPCQEAALPPTAPIAPGPTGGRIWGAETEFLSHFLSPSWWLSGTLEDPAAILWPLSLLCSQLGLAAGGGRSSDPCLSNLPPLVHWPASSLKQS